MTAAGLLLGSCAGLLAARRLCAISTRKRAGEGGPEAAQACQQLYCLSPCHRPLLGKSLASMPEWPSVIFHSP
jgi:hypothetical protein